jgi:hypothetical protein
VESSYLEGSFIPLLTVSPELNGDSREGVTVDVIHESALIIKTKLKIIINDANSLYTCLASRLPRPLSVHSRPLQRQSHHRYLLPHSDLVSLPPTTEVSTAYNYSFAGIFGTVPQVALAIVQLSADSQVGQGNSLFYIMAQNITTSGLKISTYAQGLHWIVSRVRLIASTNSQLQLGSASLRTVSPLRRTFKIDDRYVHIDNGFSNFNPGIATS